MSSRFALTWVLLLLAVLCTGCNPAQKILGVWELDKDKGAAALVGNGPMAAVFSTMASQFKMELEFKADGTWALQLSMPGTSTQSKGTWRFVKQEGQTLHLLMKANDQASEQEVQVQLVDDNNIELAPPGLTEGPMAGKTIPLRRFGKQ